MTDVPEEMMGDRPDIPTLPEWIDTQIEYHFDKSAKFNRGTVLNAYHCGWMDALSSIRSRMT